MEKKPFSDNSFEEFLEQEKLMGSRCVSCDILYAPPKPICTKCHRDSDMEWITLSGKGKLSAFTCISIGPSFMQEQGYNRKNPYCSGVVELEEGVRMDARIIGVDTKNPETIQIGMPMIVDYIHFEGEKGKTTYLAFRPAG
jgi:hypothetical protein